MDVKGTILLQLFNQRKLRNGSKKIYLEQIFSLFIVKFKKLEFRAPLGFRAPLNAKMKDIRISTDKIFLHNSSSTFFEFSSSLLLENDR